MDGVTSASGCRPADEWGIGTEPKGAAKALRIQDRLFPLQTTLFLETNPSPVKYALARLGLMTEDVRLPLLPVGEETRRAVDASLAHAGLIAA